MRTRISGKYGDAIVFTDLIEEEAKTQIKELMDQLFVSGSNVRIMPDVHAGSGCVIGTTMQIYEEVCPNLVGVDIGCGVLSIKENGKEFLNFEKLDSVIRKYVPSGFSVHSKPIASLSFVTQNLTCADKLSKTPKEFDNAIGTLGGGNHFIEVSISKNGDPILMIHSGSRNLGLQVAQYWQKVATEDMPSAKGLAYLSGQNAINYIDDMRLVQMYASVNRHVISEIITKEMGTTSTPYIETVHNYIDDYMVLRKGAVSAHKDSTLLIPMNMRDGTLVCVGKGNPEWNLSAPHGAGRIMSRTQARKTVDIDSFRKSMSGIYSSSVNAWTVDESPFAYKNMDLIMSQIGDTVDIIGILKPLYNFKATEGVK